MSAEPLPSILRRGRVRLRGQAVGSLVEYAQAPPGLAGRFVFRYEPEYLATPEALAISLSLPLRAEPIAAPSLHGFFAGLLAEGAFARSQCRRLRLDEHDLFGRVLATCHSDTIGAVTVEPITAEAS